MVEKEFSEIGHNTLHTRKKGRVFAPINSLKVFWMTLQAKSLKPHINSNPFCKRVFNFSKLEYSGKFKKCKKFAFYH